MDHFLSVDCVESLGSVKADVKELPELDVGVEFDESTERAGAEFEEDVHYFAFDSGYRIGY